MSQKTSPNTLNLILVSAIVISMLFMSATIFISQNNSQYAKAAGGTITGTMVLHDSDVPVSSVNLMLPGTSCMTTITACGDSAPDSIVSYVGEPVDVLGYGGDEICAGAFNPETDVHCGWTNAGSCSNGGYWIYVCDIGDTCAVEGGNPGHDTYDKGLCCPVGSVYIPGTRVCCPEEKPNYNPSNNMCYSEGGSFDLEPIRGCGYTYEPLPLVPSTYHFSTDVKYVSVSYSCTP